MLPRITFGRMRGVNTPKSPFDRSKNERPLRVLVDDDLGPDQEVIEHLLGFSYNDTVEVMSLKVGGNRTVHLRDLHEQGDVRQFEVLEPGKRMRAGIWPYTQLLDQARKAVADHMVQNEATAVAALEVLAIAEELEVDCLATRRQLSWVYPDQIARSNATTPELALGLIGLFLRSRDDATLWQTETITDLHNKGHFFWEATRALLPASQDWWLSCATHTDSTGDPTTNSLAAGGVRRFQHFLSARDHIQVQARRHQGDAAISETLFYLDTALVMLAGAFDATARVAHIAYSLPGSIRRAGWQKDEWRTQLFEEAPSLATLLRDDSDALALARLTSTLRNNIHGEDFRPVLLTPPTAQRETLVRVPSSSENRVRNLMHQLGGMPAWGDRDVTGGLWIEADTLVERLAERAGPAINSIMAASELPSVWPPVVVPPNEPPTDEAAYIKRCVRRLICL